MVMSIAMIVRELAVGLIKAPVAGIPADLLPGNVLCGNGPTPGGRDSLGRGFRGAKGEAGKSEGEERVSHDPTR
jgi:hypothetical protein